MTEPVNEPRTEANTVLRDAAAARGLEIGQALLGRYEVRRVIGRGAMGEVLEVRDKHSGNDYALKRVPPELVRDPGQMAGIRSNFALVSQLSHPHIATMRSLEVDSATSHAYIIMDLVRGQDLGLWLAERREVVGPEGVTLPIDCVLGIAEQIAAALDYAHSQPASRASDGKPKMYGILHRDLKPSNVMLETNREYRPGIPYVKLVDFGLAAEIQASMMSSSVQGQNKLAGTPAYMAPEQWEGRTLTRGVDQWSLAVIIYEMVAGRRPFNGPSEMAIMTQICKADPEQPATLTAAQWEVLKKTMQPDRKQRHRSCMALVKAFAEADRSTAGKIEAAEIRMPDEFTDRPSSHPKPEVIAAAGADIPTTQAGQLDAENRRSSLDCSIAGWWRFGLLAVARTRVPKITKCH